MQYTDSENDPKAIAYNISSHRSFLSNLSRYIQTVHYVPIYLKGFIIMF
jgi:hypothetical protein